MNERRVFVGFGDLLLRLEPDGFERLVQAPTLRARYTGAEANAAVMLAGLGIESRIASRVPENPIGQACINSLRAYGVDVSNVARGGERLGIFYLETGAAQRASVVIYDRRNTSFVTSTPADYDWDAILANAGWLHFSGTAAASGDSVRGALREGIRSAHDAGATVSCDLNYRAKMWSREDARREMEKLAPDIDVLFGNEADAEAVFGVRADGSDAEAGELSVESYKIVADRLRERYGFSVVATSLRQSVSASFNRWAGMMSNAHGHFVSRSYDILPIVDRVGGGDSYAAGLIYGLMHANSDQDCVEFAAAASCLKHSIPGDVNLVSEDEVRALVGGNGSGRVQR